MALEDLLTPDEKALHDALAAIANQYGKFDEDYSYEKLVAQIKSQYARRDIFVFEDWKGITVK
jgi:hypothetical protein